jgi:hypothetical protein
MMTFARHHPAIVGFILGAPFWVSFGFLPAQGCELKPMERKAKPMNEKIRQGQKALRNLLGFLSNSQVIVVRQCLKGEEGEWFADKMIELDALITNMSKTYEQNGKGDETVVYLHYFKEGADWFITEKDSDPNGEGHVQAFGLADLFNDGGELGYISIVELCQNDAELDFHFAPRTLGQVKQERNRSFATCTFDDPLAGTVR